MQHVGRIWSWRGLDRTNRSERRHRSHYSGNLLFQGCSPMDTPHREFVLTFGGQLNRVETLTPVMQSPGRSSRRRETTASVTPPRNNPEAIFRVERTRAETIRDQHGLVMDFFSGVTWFTSLSRRPGYQVIIFKRIWRSPMTVLAQTLSRISGTDVDVESLRPILFFCAIGLLASALLFKTVGLDMSIAFL